LIRSKHDVRPMSFEVGDSNTSRVPDRIKN